MFSLITMLLLSLHAFAGSAAHKASIAQADEAATLLSRFEPGTLPASPSVLTALGSLGDSGTTDHLPLLNSIVQDEGPVVRVSARSAIADIDARLRSAFRGAYSGPRHDEVWAWLSAHEPIGPAGESLGRNEKYAVAYGALVLGDTVGPTLKDWKGAGYSLEQSGHFQDAIRLYTTAIIEGDFEAIDELAEFRIDTEQLLLGVLTALPNDHPIRDRLMDWLVSNGSVTTVRVMADRTKRTSALERAIAIRALGTMIRDGKLKPNAASLARKRLERTADDPHADVSQFARATLEALTISP